MNCTPYPKLKRMKKILMAATAVGAATAGVILYLRNRNSDQKTIENSAKDTYRTMNDGLGKVERLGQHAMG
jgi:hypothetical protein